MSTGFHPGVAAIPTSARKTFKRKVATRQRGKPRHSHSTHPLTKSWFLLPSHLYPSRLINTILFSGNAYSAVLASLERKRIATLEGSLPAPFHLPEEEFEECLLLSARNQSIRNTMAALARRWLLIRCVRIMNEEDIE